MTGLFRLVFIFVIFTGLTVSKGLCLKSCNVDIGPKKVRIGILTDGLTPKDKSLVQLYKKEIVNVFEPEIQVEFCKNWIISAKGTLKGAKRGLKRLLNSNWPQMILTLGVISSTAAIKYRNLNKPVIAPFIPAFLLKKNGKIQIKNFAYIDAVYYLEKDIKTFKKITPFKKLAIVLDKREYNLIKNLNIVSKELENRLNINIHLVSADSSANQVIDSIPKEVEAVLIGPLFHINEPEEKRLYSLFIKKRLPAFALWNTRQVQLGLLACVEDKDKDLSIARRSAVALLDILHGQPPEKLKIKFVRTQQLTINMDTARRLNIYPSLLILTGANLLNNKEEDIKRRLNIKKAVEEAIEANLRLQAARVSVSVEKYRVKEAMSALLPRVDIETGYRAVDQDRAKSASGLSPERAWTGSAKGSVLLYSEKKWAQFTAQKHLELAQQMRQQIVKLDITYDASVAYLNVLRARTIERIYKENLDLTKANLERAQIKVATGAAGPDEVYRWESKFAYDRRSVLYKESETMDAMQALNRILHRPIDEPFIPEEASLKDPLFIMGDKFYFKLMENPIYFRKFKAFATKEAMKFRPELHAISYAIKAKERLRTAAKREIWLPDFTIDWKVDQYLAEDGHGRREGTLFDDTDWSIGVFARIPLFEGGKTVAKAGRLQEEVSKLEIEKNALIEAITQHVLSAINKTRASYPSIILTKDAEEAARKNLELITDSYIHGIKNIIDLLDAQNQYLNARLDSANAVYNFLIDFMGVQRAMGEFFIFMPDDMRIQWMNRIKNELGLN